MLVWLRVAVAAAGDLGLSATCGLLLAAVWLRDDSVRLPLRWCAAALCAASWAQLLMLGVTFSESASLRAILAMMPDVVGMYAGRVLLNVGWVSSGLVLWVWLVRRRPVQIAGAAVFLLGILTLRAATGHAAVDGDFSRAEVLEWTHLAAMAVWSGGVLVSGLWIAPRLQGGVGLRSYVEALSRVSTWAVGVVVASGVWKGYVAVDGDLHLWREGLWGGLLAAKVVCVAGVLGLGAWNRWMLMRSKGWDKAVAVRTLRAEAWGMAAVVVLSAALANAAPPGS